MAPQHRDAGPLLQPYLQLKAASRADLGSDEVSERLLELVTVSLNFLARSCKRVKLVSLVTGKQYFAYAKKSNLKGLSRPINAEYFEPDTAKIEAGWPGMVVGQAGFASLRRLSYTAAMAYCAAADLFDRGNKKGPATYFELFVGHLFARALGVNPQKRASIAIPGLKEPVPLTMDFIFNLGDARPFVHLPVKFSTRERVVQAWAHQRLLDASHGHGKFRGILVVFSETKLDLRTREVVEICVPSQWAAYQTYLGKIDRIYYFDVPRRYEQLAAAFPMIRLEQFARFFGEIEAVLKHPLA